MAKTEPKATKPMSKNALFLSDVIITAVEGGIGYWSRCVKYDHGTPDTVEWSERDEKRHPAVAVIREMNEDESGYKKERLEVTNAVIGRAFKKIMDKKVEIPYASDKWRKRMVAAYWDKENGAGDIDSCDADCIVQIGLFGEVRYG